MRYGVFVIPLLVLAIAASQLLVSPARAQVATPVAACPATTEAENEAIARRWHEDVINGGDLAVLDEIVASDIVHHAGTFPDGEGADAVAAVLGTLLTGFPDVRHTIEQFITADDLVITRWQAEGTHDGEFQGYAATGNAVVWTGINIFRIECGRIAEEWSEVDGVGRLRQLGVLGTPTP
ncbi:MAG: ester cyclase [Chloroflexia bacterium]|nr:ester cyclase [Chloroflexia bacterium]